tara:strand:+ start:209 stop:976 length:768 start_codon:yes stop_codon:yes gene_type:complete
MQKEQIIQSQAYKYPYHYIPNRDKNGELYPTRIWGYARSWLAASKIIERYLNKYCPRNGLHVDLGCGDGALINFLSSTNSTKIKYIGIDYDSNAINWAKIFKKNKNVSFKKHNLLESDALKNLQADTLSLIEVIEHIPPKTLKRFLNKTSSLIKKNGHLILTVPHKNKVLQKKHYQHFSFKSLRDNIPKQFRIIELWGFESLPLPFHLRLIRKLMESKNHYFETKYTNKLIIDQLALKVSERKTGRIFCIAQKLN